MMSATARNGQSTKLGKRPWARLALAMCGETRMGLARALFVISFPAVLGGPARAAADDGRMLGDDPSFACSDHALPTAQAQPNDQGMDLEALIGEFDLDAELEALIAELDPPPLEQILSWFEPIPTVGEALSPLPDDPNVPHKRVLSEGDQALVDDLATQLDELSDLGQFSDAIPLAEKVLEIRRRSQGEDYWQTADASRQLRRLRAVAALPSGAQAELEQAEALDMQGAELHRQHRHREALPMLLRAAQMRGAHLGMENADFAKSVNDIAYFLERAGRWKLAEEGCRAALALRVGLFGKQHPDVASSLDSLGYVSRRNRALSAAVSCHSKAAVLRRRLFGDAHPDVEGSVFGLANALLEQGDYLTAERAFRALLSSPLKNSM